MVFHTSFTYMLGTVLPSFTNVPLCVMSYSASPTGVVTVIRLGIGRSNRCFPISSYNPLSVFATSAVCVPAFVVIVIYINKNSLIVFQTVLFFLLSSDICLILIECGKTGGIKFCPKVRKFDGYFILWENILEGRKSYASNHYCRK